MFRFEPSWYVNRGLSLCPVVDRFLYLELVSPKLDSLKSKHCIPHTIVSLNLYFVIPPQVIEGI